jgi:hypothetical protein
MTTEGRTEMRRVGGAVLAALACVTAAGCLTRPDGPAAASRAASLFAPAQPDGLFVESVLLERPVGDPLLDRDLWATDTARLPPRTAALLAENGLRAVVLSGNLPPAFLKVLGSEADTVNPVRMTFANRTEAVIPTAGPTDPCEYAVLPDLGAERVPAKLSQARCGVLVRPERVADGRVRLTCEPRVQHGERQDFLRPSTDGTEFVLEGEVPTERYPGLGFDVTLGANEYLLVGAPAGATGTLGAALFGVEADGRPRQRVLVVRAGYRGEVPSDLPVIAGARGRSIAAEVARW